MIGWCRRYAFASAVETRIDALRDLRTLPEKQLLYSRHELGTARTHAYLVSRWLATGP